MKSAYSNILCVKFTFLIYLGLLMTACFEENNYAAAFKNGNYERSFFLLKKSAKTAPDPYVHNLLGYHHELGLATPRDYEQAFTWYSKAAIADLPEAQVNLAKLLEYGRGVPADPALAYGWYWAAYRSGHESALPYVQNLSGQIYPHLIEDARIKVGKILNRELNVIE